MSRPDFANTSILESTRSSCRAIRTWKRRNASASMSCRTSVAMRASPLLRLRASLPTHDVAGRRDLRQPAGALEIENPRGTDAFAVRARFASLAGVAIAGVYASDDQFGEGRPSAPVLARVDAVAAVAIALAGATPA